MQEGAIIVVLCWLMAIATSTISFMAVGGLNFTQAVFEAASGWTATKLSVVAVEQTSHLILLFRSVTQLIGGAGLTAAEGRVISWLAWPQDSIPLWEKLFESLFAIGAGVLDQIVIDNQHIPPLLHKIFRHGCGCVRGDVL